MLQRAIVQAGPGRRAERVGVNPDYSTRAACPRLRSRGGIDAESIARLPRGLACKASRLGGNVEHLRPLSGLLKRLETMVDMPGRKYPSSRAANHAGRGDLRRFATGRRCGDREKIGPERPISTLEWPFSCAAAACVVAKDWISRQTTRRLGRRNEKSRGDIDPHGYRSSFRFSLLRMLFWTIV